jgi:hypothetical protein
VQGPTIVGPFLCAKDEKTPNSFRKNVLTLLIRFDTLAKSEIGISNGFDLGLNHGNQSSGNLIHPWDRRQEQKHDLARRH